MMVRQLHRMRIGFNGRLEGAKTMMITFRILVATAIMAGLAYGVWSLVDRVVGTSLLGQILSVGLALAISSAVYAWLTLAMRIPEARQIQDLVLTRIGRG
ncbi:MAG: hypothetical protein JOZ73_04885 [Solirubrobacterales bacterium]|nr:hypothetical protein [Solirubrobacterales bacterium]